MATKEQLAQAVTDLTTSITGEIQRVTDKITALQNAGNDGVSPADLDGPIADLVALKAAVDGVAVDSAGTVTGAGEIGA